MALFGKKSDEQTRSWASPSPSDPLPPPVATPSVKYGIADAITLIRGLPLGENGDLVIQVVRATLASLKVRLSDIIEDATRKQKLTQERIATALGQVAALEQKLAEHHLEIKALEADLKETTEVKERLVAAERSSGDDTSPGIGLAGQPEAALRT